MRYDNDVIQVGIGDIKIVRREEQLTAILGSCIAIIIVDPLNKKTACAHCQLPKGPIKFDLTTKKGRFVDQAIPAMLAMLRTTAEHYSKLKVFVVGGGSMADLGDQLVGQRNLNQAVAVLEKLRLPFVMLSTGGSIGRQITMTNGDDGPVVKPIERLKDIS